VLAAFVSSLAVPVLGTGHAQAEDTGFCDPFLLAGGHPTDQFEKVLPPGADDHCAICHWLQAVRGVELRTAADAQAPVDAIRVGASIPVLTGGRTLVAERSSRAPPALPL
jgi:hypothetical protein